jgi:hypothetical protein
MGLKKLQLLRSPTETAMLNSVFWLSVLGSYTQKYLLFTVLRNTGQGETPHRKYKRLKLGGGHPSTTV